MKNLGKTFLMALVMVAFSLNALGQASATAEASAIIIAPISISSSANMDFDLVAASATSGTVVLATDGSTSTTGGATVPTTNAATAAVFTVTGQDGYTYSITLPGTVVLDDGSGNTMNVDNFTSDPSGTGTLSGGTETLRVGATLNVGINQTPGTYENLTDLEVTVNYN